MTQSLREDVGEPQAGRLISVGWERGEERGGQGRLQRKGPHLIGNLRGNKQVFSPCDTFSCVTVLEPTVKTRSLRVSPAQHWEQVYSTPLGLRSPPVEPP